MSDSVLDIAKNVINGERQDTYGNPEDSFLVIGQYWTTYLCQKKDPCNIQPKDVAIMMTLFKIARMKEQVFHKDNVIDALGYLAILGDRIEK